MLIFFMTQFLVLYFLILVINSFFFSLFQFLLSTFYASFGQRIAFGLGYTSGWIIDGHDVELAIPSWGRMHTHVFWAKDRNREIHNTHPAHAWGVEFAFWSREYLRPHPIAVVFWDTHYRETHLAGKVVRIRNLLKLHRLLRVHLSSLARTGLGLLPHDLLHFGTGKEKKIVRQV